MATFVNVSVIQPDLSTPERVSIPKADFGRELRHDECLDVITYINRTAQEKYQSETVAAQVDKEEVAFQVPAEELDNLLAEIQQPKKTIAKKRSPPKETASN